MKDEELYQEVGDGSLLWTILGISPKSMIANCEEFGVIALICNLVPYSDLQVGDLVTILGVFDSFYLVVSENFPSIIFPILIKDLALDKKRVEVPVFKTKEEFLDNIKSKSI